MSQPPEVVIAVIRDRVLSGAERVLERICDSLGKRCWAKLALTTLVLAYVVGFGWMVFQRHYHFNSAGFDLGLQEQVVWSTSRGRPFQISFETGNYLGDHFQPLMALLSPLYWLRPSVYWMLAFQTVVLALGAIPVFRLSRRHLGSHLAGLVFAAVYLIYPAVGYINRFDFHWESTIVPLLLSAADFVDAGRLRWASVFLALTLLGKEEIGLTVAAFGVVVALRGRRRFGALWAISGVLFSLIALFVLIPAFRAGASDTLGRYAWLGSTPGEMVATLVTKPAVLVERQVPSRALSLGFQLLAPVAFLLLLSAGELFILLPSLGYNLLSSFSPQHTIYYQYVAPTVPFVLVGAIRGMGTLQRLLRSANAPRYITWMPWGGLVVVALVAGFRWSPLRDTGRVPPAWSRLPNEGAVRTALAQVPAEAAVFTTNPYAPHLSQRDILRVFVYHEDLQCLSEVDAVFLNVRDQRSLGSELSCDDYGHFVEVAATDGFGVTFRSHGALVLRRGTGDAITPDLVDQLVRRCEATRSG